MLCGFTASTRGGLRVHSARKHSMGKNKAKLVEGVYKRAEEEPVAPIDETVTNNDCDENLCSNENLCMLCGFTASTRGGLRVHSARKHSMGKNKAKLVKGVKRAKEE